jgi:hypothetical protein
MLRTIFALAARSASIDRDSNSLSVFEIFEGVQATGFPLAIPEMVFVTLLEKQSGSPAPRSLDFSATLSGVGLHRQSFPCDFQGSDRFRFVLRLAGLVVPGVGRLTLEILGQDAPVHLDIRGPEVAPAEHPNYRPLIPGR